MATEENMITVAPYLSYEGQCQLELNDLEIQKNELKGKKNRHKRGKVNKKIEKIITKLVEFNNLEKSDYQPALEEDWVLKAARATDKPEEQSDWKHLKVYEERLNEAGSKLLRNMTGKRLKEDFGVTNGKHRIKLLKVVNDHISGLNFQNPLNRGWTKHTIEEGDGKTFPKVGHELTVLYHGTLRTNPTFCFDECWNTQRPFKFVVGKKGVIRGWDEGLLDFSKGERAKLTIRSDYAYGERSTRAIPGNSDLIFDVQLLDINDAPKKPAQFDLKNSGLDLAKLLGADSDLPENLRESLKQINEAQLREAFNLNKAGQIPDKDQNNYTFDRFKTKKTEDIPTETDNNPVEVVEVNENKSTATVVDEMKEEEADEEGIIGDDDDDEIPELVEINQTAQSLI